MANNFPISPSTRILSREEFDHVLDSLDDVIDYFFGSREVVRANVREEKVIVLNRSLDEAEIRQIIYILGDESQGLYDAIMSQSKPRDRSYTTKRSKVRYRVAIVKSSDIGSKKIRIVMRRLKKEPWLLKDLRIPPGYKEAIMTSQPGLVIIAGATGSGKTSLLSGGLRLVVETPEKNPHLLTIEDPVEYIYSSVAHENAVVTAIEIGSGCSSFEEGLRAAMRLNPTHILVGEIRDPETAATCISAARSGHRVFATIHTSSVAEIFSRWADFYPESAKKRAISDLSAVIDYALYQTLGQNESGYGPVQESLSFMQNSINRNELVGLLSNNTNDIYNIVNQLVNTFGTPYEKDWAALNPAGAKQRLSYEKSI